MLPRVKIIFQNGALGQTTALEDGVMGLVCTGVAVGATFLLSTAYIIRSFAQLATLGITQANNPAIVKYFTEFYDEAPEGTEHWMMAFPDTVKASDMVDKNQNYAVKLINAANGRLNGIVVQRTPAAGYIPTITGGLDGDVASAMLKAQSLADWTADTLASPVFVCLEGYAFSGNPVDLTDLHSLTYSSVMVALGDTVTGSKSAAMGMLAGRISSVPIQINIGRVKSGPLKSLTAFVGNTPVEAADVTSIHDKGYITLCTFPRRAGYFYADDWMATSATDDYCHLTARRTINKAFRVAYDTLSEEILETIYVNENGTMQVPIIKGYEALVEKAVANSMTANGELSADITNPNDKGVKCYIDPAQNVVSSSKWTAVLRVRPFGYNRYIDVPLGFQVVTA